LSKDVLSRKNALLIVLIGFAVVFLSSGIKTSYQVYFVEMADAFAQSRGGFAMAAAIFMLTFGIASPIVGSLSDRIGPKRTILLGLSLSGFAFVAAALINHFWVFVFLYGVVAAFGLTAMSYVPMGLLVDQSFDKKHQGLIYAVLTNGAAIGFMVMSPLWVFTQGVYNWQQIYFALGIIFLWPLYLMVKNYMPADAPASVDVAKQTSFGQRTRQIFRVRPLYVLMFGFTGCGVTMAFIDVHMVAHFQDIGLSKAQVSTALVVLGALELVGGFLAGWMCDRLPKSYVITGFYLLRAASLGVLWLFPNMFGVLLFAAMFGLSYLGTVVGTSMYTLNLFGKEVKGFAFGFIWLAHQIGAFLSTQIGANIHDWYGNYEWTILITASIALISALVSLLFLKPNPEPA